MREDSERLKINTSNYPRTIEHLCDLLSDSKGRTLLIEEMQTVQKQLENGEKELRVSYVKRPTYLLEQISDLEREPNEYPFSDKVEIRKEDFITQERL